MKKLGVKEVYIKDLLLPGDIKERLVKPHVRELAKSMKHLNDLKLPNGTLHEPFVRQGTLEVITGGDRIAAHMVNGWTAVRAQIVECQDEEVEIIRRTENAHRRHSAAERDEELRRFVDALAAKESIQARVAIIQAERRRNGKARGRPPSARSVAIRDAAQKLGIKEDTLKKRIYRTVKLADEVKATPRFDPDAPEAPEAPPELELHGVEPSDQWLAWVKIIRRDLRECLVHMANLKRAMTALENSGAPKQERQWRKARTLVDNASDELRGYMPVAVCPHCKLVPVVQGECSLCSGCGWISRDQSETRSLADLSEVVYRGDVRPITDFNPDPFADLEDEDTDAAFTP